MTISRLTPHASRPTLWTIARARDGAPALARPDGTWYDSRFKPEIDAARRVAELGVAAGETVLLIGAGAGALPAAILDAVGAAGRVIVFEPEAGVIDALRSVSREAPWNDVRLSLIARGEARGDEPPGWRLHGERDALLRALVAADACDRFLVHPGLRLDEEFAELRTMIDDLEIRHRSWKRFRPLVERNLAANRERFLAAPGVGELRGLLSGATIVVAGGGPSLDELAPRLGAAPVWIAVGRALDPLACRGIRPFMAVITDPQEEAARQVAELALPPLVVFPTTAASAVARATTLFAALPEGEGGRRLAPLREEIGELPAGGTVTTTAIGLAVLLGAARVLLAGVDLTEPGGRSHARGGHGEATAAATLSRFQSVEERRRRSEAELRHRGERIEIRSIRGEPVPTRKNLRLYARAIEHLARRHSAVEFIQLAAAAAPLAGVRFAPTLPAFEPIRAFSLPSGVRTRKNRDLL